MGHEVEVSGCGQGPGHALAPIAGPVVPEDVMRPAEECLVAQADHVSHVLRLIAGEREELAVIDGELEALQAADSVSTAL